MVYPTAGLNVRDTPDTPDGDGHALARPRTRGRPRPGASGPLAACPECDDPARLAAGLTPHRSVGQAGSVKEAERMRDAFWRTQEPTRFGLSAVAVLRPDRV